MTIGVRQFQVVWWDERGVAVAGSVVPLGPVLDGEDAYQAALQVAHVTELILLNEIGAAAAEASEIPAVDPNQLVLF